MTRDEFTSKPPRGSSALLSSAAALGLGDDATTNYRYDILYTEGVGYESDEI